MRGEHFLGDAAEREVRTDRSGLIHLVGVNRDGRDGPKVSVERLNYPPARLSEFQRLACRLVEGRTVPGLGTRTRLSSNA